MRTNSYTVRYRNSDGNSDGDVSIRMDNALCACLAGEGPPAMCITYIVCMSGRGVLPSHASLDCSYVRPAGE